VTEHFDELVGLRRGMQPAEEVISSVSSIIDIHIDGTIVLYSLSGITEVYAVTKLVHGLKKGRSCSGTGSWAATRALGGPDDGRSWRITVRSISYPMGSFHAVYYIVQGLLPHCKRAGGCTHDGET
jgi:hypothetical protein